MISLHHSAARSGSQVQPPSLLIENQKLRAIQGKAIMLWWGWKITNAAINQRACDVIYLCTLSLPLMAEMTLHFGSKQVCVRWWLRFVSESICAVIKSSFLTGLNVRALSNTSTIWASIFMWARKTLHILRGAEWKIKMEPKVSCARKTC